MADAGKAGIANPGAHGFSEILYALQLGRQQQRQRLRRPVGQHALLQRAAGASPMWFGRFGVIVPVLAIAGALAAKKRLPVTAGTMPTHGPLFVTLLIGTVLLVGLLNYVPALALGPVVEHLMLWKHGHGAAHGRNDTPHDDIRKTLTLFDPALVEAGRCSTSFTKLSPRVQWRNPVMFVVYVGSDPHHRAVAARAAATRAKACRRPSSSPSRCGCGSRCSSPTSPKRWPKAAARHRPPRCAA